MDGFRRMLWVGRQHSADHIPVSALQLDKTIKHPKATMATKCDLVKLSYPNNSLCEPSRASSKMFAS